MIHLKLSVGLWQFQQRELFDEKTSPKEFQPCRTRPLPRQKQSQRVPGGLLAYGAFPHLGVRLRLYAIRRTLPSRCGSAMETSCVSAFCRSLAICSHPDHVKYVLHDHQRNYDKQSPLVDLVRPLFGNGLFTNNGESWLHQRRLMQPSFHHKRLAHFGTVMTDTTCAMLERWQDVGSHPLDIEQEMTRLTLRIAGLTLFHLDLNDAVDTVGRTFNTVLPLLLQYASAPYLPLWVPTPSNRRLQAGLETLNSVVYTIINERRKQLTDSGTETGDRLSMLLEARDEDTGKMMNDQQVRDEVMTLLVAGHETTSVALTWT